MTNKINNNNNKNRILLVEDELDIALAFKIGLEDNGFIVDAYINPKEASANFKPDLYDLLLLDIKMPDLNGMEFYQSMRIIDKKVKVCFITASEFRYYETITKEIFPILGIGRLLRKPIRINDLVKSITQELESTNGDNGHIGSNKFIYKF
jgi:two-component system catabolic regulation response regulator CreB/two-component system response regulator ChvI